MNYFVEYLKFATAESFCSKLNQLLMWFIQKITDSLLFIYISFTRTLAHLPFSSLAIIVTVVCFKFKHHKIVRSH